MFTVSVREFGVSPASVACFSSPVIFILSSSCKSLTASDSERNMRLYWWQCNRKWSALSCCLPPPPRSCVSIWTAGGWTADWDSASLCSTSSSSSAPSASRSCRGHTRIRPPHVTDPYRQDSQTSVFNLHCCHCQSKVRTDEFSSHYAVAVRVRAAAWKLHCLPLINEYFT